MQMADGIDPAWTETHLGQEKEKIVSITDEQFTSADGSSLSRKEQEFPNLPKVIIKIAGRVVTVIRPEIILPTITNENLKISPKEFRDKFSNVLLTKLNERWPQISEIRIDKSRHIIKLFQTCLSDTLGELFSELNTANVASIQNYKVLSKPSTLKSYMYPAVIRTEGVLFLKSLIVAGAIFLITDALAVSLHEGIHYVSAYMAGADNLEFHTSFFQNTRQILHEVLPTIFDSPKGFLGGYAGGYINYNSDLLPQGANLAIGLSPHVFWSGLAYLSAKYFSKSIEESKDLFALVLESSSKTATKIEMRFMKYCVTYLTPFISYSSTLYFASNSFKYMYSTIKDLNGLIPGDFQLASARLLGTQFNDPLATGFSIILAYVPTLILMYGTDHFLQYMHYRKKTTD